MTHEPPRQGEGDRPLAGGGGPRPSATSGYRHEFIAALQLFARASQAMHERGLSRPILVGGAAAVHPALGLGFEVVAEVLMDGSVDQTHVRLVQSVGAAALFRVISVEDLIADRMGQFASGTAPDRREQARLLLALHPGG